MLSCLASCSFFLVAFFVGSGYLFDILTLIQFLFWLGRYLQWNFFGLWWRPPIAAYSIPSESEV